MIITNHKLCDIGERPINKTWCWLPAFLTVGHLTKSFMVMMMTIMMMLMMMLMMMMMMMLLMMTSSPEASGFSPDPEPSVNKNAVGQKSRIRSRLFSITTNALPPPDD